MPATVTLSTTTLSAPVDAHDGTISVASTSGLFAGTRLYVEGELMRVIGLLVGSLVKVIRGVDGTKGSAHPSSATVYIGEAHQFYSQDPKGRPPAAIPVSPYINVTNGTIWFARGDSEPADSIRWWQAQTVTHSTGSFGVRTTTYDPTEST